MLKLRPEARATGSEKNKSPALVGQRRLGPGLQLRGKEAPGFTPTNHRKQKKKKKPEQYGVAKGVEMLDNLLEEGAKQWGHSTPDSALPVVP